MLLLADADADLADAEGFTPLQLAEAGGHVSAATRLNMVPAEKSRRREPAKPDDAYFPDFLAAARIGNLGEVERLMAAGAPFPKTDSEGFTALMYAVRAGHRDVALRLMLAGLHPDSKGDWLVVDESAIFLAITEGYDDLSAMLLLGGATGRVGFTPALVAATSSGRGSRRSPAAGYKDAGARRHRDPRRPRSDAPAPGRGLQSSPSCRNAARFRRGSRAPAPARLSGTTRRWISPDARATRKSSTCCWRPARKPERPQLQTTPCGVLASSQRRANSAA